MCASTRILNISNLKLNDTIFVCAKAHAGCCVGCTEKGEYLMSPQFLGQAAELLHVMRNIQLLLHLPFDVVAAVKASALLFVFAQWQMPCRCGCIRTADAPSPTLQLSAQ